MTTMRCKRWNTNRRAIRVLLLCCLPAIGSAEAPPSPPFPAAMPPSPQSSPAAPQPPVAASQSPPAVPQPPLSPPVPATKGFYFKFNNADIYEVIHTMARAAKINYLVDSRVKGVVNVQTQGVVDTGGVMELLLAILKINGATAIRVGGTYHIVPLAEAKMEALSPVVPGDNTEKGTASQVVLRVFPLKYIIVSDMAKVIRPLLSPGAEAIEVAPANTLLVIDTEGNNEKTAGLVKLFDSEDFRSAGMKLFRLKVLDPEEMAKNLAAIYGALDASGGGGRPSWINFVPVPRLGAIMVVCASPGTLADVSKWIDELDRETSSAARSYRRYRVKNGKVKDIAAVIQQMFPKRTALLSAGTDKPTEFRPMIGQSAGANPPPTPQSTAPVAATAGGKESAKGSEGGFEIVSDEPTNSLVVRASGSEFAELLELLKVVDVYPQQVLLEVLVGEVNLDDTLRLGVDWKYIGTANGYGQTVAVNPVQSIGTGTFSYLIEKTGRLTVAFRALATAGKASVLSSPSVIATNGKKSKINVADSIPIVTSTILSNSNPPVTTTTVEYRDVGVLLSFTPFINESGMVTLEIDQEVSEVSSTTTASNPSFFKRTISTNLVASQDQSIVLGGLVKERRELNRDGIPFLSRIPGLGWLFGSRGEILKRTELLIFITPRVVRSVEEGNRMSRDFEDRVEELKARLGETSGIRSKSGSPPVAAPGQ